jgi:aldose 1-epimerase
VVFTPPHRQAFCLEPYTCPTDAINMPEYGKSVGWLTLPPGGQWKADFEMATE